MTAMNTNDVTLRHLLDLCRRSEKTGLWQYSAFLSPAEQEDLIRSGEAAGFAYQLTGGYENAERKILAAGSEEEMGPPDPPVSVIEVKPKSEKFAEKLTHRDYLGSILGLGIDRGLIGDIIVRDRGAWFFCLSSAAGLIASSLTQVRRTAVRAVLTAADIPELQPRYAELRLNVASERLDAVTAAFAGLSRAQADKLFASEKVFVNGRTVTDRSFRLKEGDVLSVRGFGKAVYDGIDHETRKNRFQVRLRKLI
jgi:RNA-binding protein YlmH